MSNFLKATALQDTVLTALSRMTVLAPTVWRNAGGSFRGAEGDTITIRVPAYTAADSRTMRSGSTRTRRGLFETKVPVALTKNLYRDVALTDEQQTLDIMNFARQVLNPMLEGIARGIEEHLVTTMNAASYSYTQTVDASDPIDAVFAARKDLNDAAVPFTNRFLALGSSVEYELLNSSNLRQVSESGSDSELREGRLFRLAGFQVLSVPGLNPGDAYAYHSTAFTLGLEAPIVPAGAPSGFTAVKDGFAIRLVQVLDSATIENIVAGDVFCGAAVTKDYGTVAENGKFTPDETPDLDNDTPIAVRAVKLQLGASS
jgi:hypothetical protein